MTIVSTQGQAPTSRQDAEPVRQPRVQSVAKVANILFAVAQSADGLKALEISAQLGLPRQATYHLLHTLVTLGMLTKTADNRYLLGLRVGALAEAFPRHLAPPERLLPYVRQVASETGETTYAVGWVEGEIAALAVVRGRFAVQTAEIPHGTCIDAHARASGKLLLAFPDPALRDRWASGSAMFDLVGCNDCHRREMLVKSPFWTERPDTTEGEGIEISLLIDGEGPKASPLVQLYSDLKRHDMGPELADPHDDDGTGVAASVFLTRPLWGLAETAPYLHDGRAPTIPDAIVAHGGEATESRDAYLALPEREQADLHVFLLSLTRAPKVRIPR